MKVCNGILPKWICQVIGDPRFISITSILTKNEIIGQGLVSWGDGQSERVLCGCDAWETLKNLQETSCPVS